MLPETITDDLVNTLIHEKIHIYQSIINDSDLMHYIIKVIMTYDENTKDEYITFDNFNFEKILCLYVYIYAMHNQYNPLHS